MTCWYSRRLQEANSLEPFPVYQFRMGNQPHFPPMTCPSTGPNLWPNPHQASEIFPFYHSWIPQLLLHHQTATNMQEFESFVWSNNFIMVSRSMMAQRGRNFQCPLIGPWAVHPFWCMIFNSKVGVVIWIWVSSFIQKHLLVLQWVLNLIYLMTSLQWR